jgi:signal transduction histidine kinase
VRREPADVTATLRGTVSQVGPRAAGLGITITEHYPPDPCVATMDVEKVARVVENVLANALRFTPRDGHIEVSVLRAEGEVLVKIWDDGKPIPEQVRDRIFDKFVPAEAARRHQRSSVGLGLTFCKMAVEAMGGRIWVTSSAADGTAFTFTLPAR